MTRDGQEPGGGTRRSMRSLYGACAAYWAALPVAALWTPATTFLRLRDRMPGRAALTLNLAGDEGIALQLTADAASVWSGAISYLALAGWLAGPPLVLWAVWLWWAGRDVQRGGVPQPAGAAPLRELHAAPPPDAFVGVAARTPEGVRSPVDRVR